MSLIDKKKLDYLKFRPEEYANCFQNALKPAKTTHDRLEVINEYIGILSEDRLLQRWKASTFGNKIHFILDQIPSFPESTIRTQAYKNVTGILTYSALFQKIGSKNAVSAMNRTLEDSTRDPDPEVRLASYAYLAKSLQNPQIHGKLSDQETHTIIDGLQGILLHDKMATNTLFEKNYRDLVHKPLVVASLMRSGVNAMTYKHKVTESAMQAEQPHGIRHG